MKQVKLLLACVAASFTLLTGCQKEADSTVAPVATTQSAQLSAAATIERVEQLRATLPAGVEEKLQQRSARLLQTDPQYRDLAQRLLAVEPTPCDDSTPLNLWLDGQLSDWNRQVINYAIRYDMLNLPSYYAFVFENSSANQSFGQNGEYSQRLTKSFKDLRRFWTIESGEMVMVAMHGNVLLDQTKIAKTYEAAYGVSKTTAATLAQIVALLADQIPQFRDGTHPIFTFNAFALDGFDYPPFATIPDKIVMGDGIMEGYTAIGFGDVAPQAILAHEFGHQIQFALNLFGDVESPEATRRTELMADAYSAYYLSHARGAAMQWKRVRLFLEVFFNIGDCAFTSDGHHGTPAQRMAAAEWGYSLANNAQKQGHILSPQEFARLFDAQLPQLVM
ncbi:neutral zinc metallopeptidase [Hymenobacter latericus]|uniref:neutral zinc metallopeptidase n=1 Tax=Hymenobacter sp. YIM 151858-1 TaxID=2987688 RepID=UPI0022265F81|nr:neutral zinc metallopeptidase [Hymenobacter sp. YIM 151858-1]UYZ59680.1 neutral zinc metallopeptidase [Hymenobacter sp. YIM 151858-1]